MKGDFLNGKKEGSGTLYYENEKLGYCGLFKNNKFEGVGILLSKEGKLFSGIFHNGEINGYCEIYDKEGKLTLEDNFINGEHQTNFSSFINFMKNKIQNFSFYKK